MFPAELSSNIRMYCDVATVKRPEVGPKTTTVCLPPPAVLNSLIPEIFWG